MSLTQAEHYRAAERLLSQASFVKPDMATPSLDPHHMALILARAQVHATLAASEVDVPVRPERPDPDALVRVVVGQIAEGLMSPSRETRDFMRGFADELNAVGMRIHNAVYELSERTGSGPDFHTVDGVTWSLLVQLENRWSTVWEHTGDWTADGQPMMGTPDKRPALDNRPFDELLRDLWPLVPVTESVPW